MTRTRFEVVPPPMSATNPGIAAPAPAPGYGAIGVGLVVLALVVGAAGIADRQLRQFLSGLDEQRLGQASASLEQLLARQRDQLVSEVTVLADDNRIRSTVLAPKFDEATVQDILEDLRKSSGATLLAVVDAGGKVIAVAGAAGLREVNLGASPAVKTGFDRPTSDVWTLPDQVQVVGVAPIRSGDQTPALLVKGLSLGRSQLATVGKALGVTGALFIGERVAASSTDAQDLDGTIATKPDVLPLSIGDGELCDTALTTVPVVEMFRYWLQGGRITVGFLGGAQIDRFANLNTTVVGRYEQPKTRLPGGGGAPEISSACGEIFIIMRQAPRSFVETLDFVTSFGHGEGGDHRARLGLATKGPTRLVTDLAVFEPDPATREMTVTSIHPGVTREQISANTGWPVRFAAGVTQTPVPTQQELSVLRELHARTASAHAAAAA